MTARLLIFAVCLIVSTGCGWSDDETNPQPSDEAETDLDDPTGFFTVDELQTLEQFGPLGAVPDDPTNEYATDEQAAHFGQFLFFEERLSGTENVSCATCHQPDHGFADPAPLSAGIGETDRHTPSLLNTSYNKWFFWDGRADSAWAQIHTPLEAPNEQGISRAEVAHFIDDNPELRQAYEQIFDPLPDLSDTEAYPEEARPIPDETDHPEHENWIQMSEQARRDINRVMANVGKAIAAYERKLVSKDAPFDTFMEGLEAGDPQKVNALSTEAKRGLRLFIGKAGCNECHSGPLLSDRAFHNLGLPDREWLPESDLGRYAGIPTVKQDPFNARGPFSAAPDGNMAEEVRFVVQKSENRGQFKTPTLRNVSKTAPYMHGGHFETLEEVIEFYADLDPQVDVGHREFTLERFDITDAEVDDLVAFLKSLEGQPVDDKLTEQPESPLPQ